MTHTPQTTPDGLQKCGTTSLAEHLKRHPGLSGVCGLPYHDTLSKESHFFAGVLGRGSMAHSAAAYRSFFPTFVSRWWAEVVIGVDKVSSGDNQVCIIKINDKSSYA